MNKRGVLHLVGAMIITAVYLLAASPAIAQFTIVPLSQEDGVQAIQDKSTTSSTDSVTADIAFCQGAVGAFAIIGVGTPFTVETFKVTQTVSGILEFSNFRDGLFTNMIEVTVTLGADGTGQSSPFYIKGANLGQTVFSACSPRVCTINQAAAIVVNVATLEYEEVNSPLDANPNIGGGLRIFPDKTSPDDMVDRRIVYIKATLSSEYQGMPVYFRGFDVDDPSSDVGPVDTSDEFGVFAPDNRGEEAIGAIVSARTDSSGVTRASASVSMQPGDNYRIAASCISQNLSETLVAGTDLKDGGGLTLPSHRANATPLLTVWRRLHIELDSMGSVVANDNFGIVLKARPSEKKGKTVLTLSATLDDYRRFEEGRITLENLGSFPVVKSGRGTVTVQGVIANDAAAGKRFTLVDDDDFNDNDGSSLDGDVGEDLLEPDTSLIQDSDDPERNVFAPAYVRPTYDLDGSGDVSFVLNYGGDSRAPIITDVYEFNSQGTERDAHFWTVYLLGAYQYTTDADGDADGAVFGASDGSLLGASVFLETVRPREFGDLASNPAVSNAATTAHEIGHSFQRDEGEDGGLMDQSWRRQRTSFSDVTLDLIRSAAHP